MRYRLLIILFAAMAVSCSKHVERGYVDLHINYELNDNPLIVDSLCYSNEFGNTFMITEIQWFLSNIELLDQDGEWHTLRQRSALDSLAMTTQHIFYIDTDIARSQTLHSKKIPVGNYTSLRFTFGLDEYDNETGIFTDPPESEMFWPDLLGGGYHYMKLNGKFVDSEGRLAPMAIHLGIGQNEDYTEYYQNYFIVELPIDFTVTEDAGNQLELTMVIDNWFRTPNLIDLNDFSGGIMQNQAAQRLFNGNSNDVFRIGKPANNENNIAMKEKENLREKFCNIMQKATPKPHFWSWESLKERFESFKSSRPQDFSI